MNVNSAPTATSSDVAVAEGGNATLTLLAEDDVDCPSSVYSVYASACGLLEDGTYSGRMSAVLTQISPIGAIEGLYIAAPAGSGYSPSVLRCTGPGGMCVPPIDLGGTQLVYVPPAPTNPAASLAPPGKAF